MLKQSLAILALAIIAAPAAHAVRVPAAYFGLTPDTGYREAVSELEYCDSKTDVLFTKNKKGALESLTKCDGSPIGWVTRNIQPTSIIPETDFPHKYVLVVESNEAFDLFGKTSIVIQTCGPSRAHELVDFTVVRTLGARANYETILGLRLKGKTIQVQLFYNSDVYSEKCIGEIREG